MSQQMSQSNQSGTSSVPCRELLGGVSIPQLGLGTWLINNNDVVNQVKTAIRDHGYRYIDTAAMYGNEEGVGKAIKQCIDEGICKRDELFITTKLWIDRRGDVEHALRESLTKLNLDYVDLYLMHFMLPNINKSTMEVSKESLQDTWREMEKCQEKGLTRAIGVSNCMTVMLMDLLSFCEIKPACNQIECHPYFSQEPVIELHKKLGIPVQAYAPINPQENPYTPNSLKGEKSVLENSVIQELSKKYNKTPAQIVLNWHIRRDSIIFPRSTNSQHMKENMEIFNFELSESDCNRISDLNKNARFYSNVPTAEYSFVPICQ